MTKIAWSVIYQDLIDVYGESLDETKSLRAANRVIDDLKVITNLPTQKRIDLIPYVYKFEKYKLPVDYKTEGLIDLRYNDRLDNNRNRTYVTEEPPFERNNVSWNKMTVSDWTERSLPDTFCIQSDLGFESLFLANGRSNQVNVEISNCDSLTGWVGSGGVENLTLDDDVKAEGDYSINYDITAGTTAILTLTLTTAVDLSEYINAGLIRLYKWLPTAPASIEIRVGSSSSNYYYQTITKQADGVAFNTIDMNELELLFGKRKSTDVAGTDYATTSGSPDSASITHFQIRMTFDSAITDTDFRIDQITAWKPEYLEFEYYSNYFASNASEVWQEYLTETAGTDQYINILKEWRKMFIYGILTEYGSLDGDSRFTYWKNEFGGRDSNGRLFGWLGNLQRQFGNFTKKVSQKWY